MPFDGVKIDLEIKDKSYRNSDLVLRISFTLKNESKTEIYTALSPSCRITNLSRLIIETFVPFSQEKWIGSSESKTGYNRYSITAKIVKFTTDVNLPYITIQIIQDNFEKSFRLGTIFFDIEIIFPILISNVNQVKELEDSKLMKYCVRHPIEGPAWRDWMTNWGFPETTYEKIHELMRKYGYLNQGELFQKLCRFWSLHTVPIVSLKRRNSYDNTLKDTFEDLIKSVEKILYIAVQMIDTNYLKEIINASKQKC